MIATVLTSVAGGLVQMLVGTKSGPTIQVAVPPRLRLVSGMFLTTAQLTPLSQFAPPALQAAQAQVAKVDHRRSMRGLQLEACCPVQLLLQQLRQLRHHRLHVQLHREQRLMPEEAATGVNIQQLPEDKRLTTALQVNEGLGAGRSTSNGSSSSNHGDVMSRRRGRRSHQRPRTLKMSVRGHTARSGSRPCRLKSKFGKKWRVPGSTNGADWQKNMLVRTRRRSSGQSVVKVMLPPAKTRRGLNQRQQHPIGLCEIPSAPRSVTEQNVARLEQIAAPQTVAQTVDRRSGRVPVVMASLARTVPLRTQLAPINAALLIVAQAH